AQLLSSVRQAPGGGRDLYASPDGTIYRRKNDGWYRRENSGNWSFFAPLQGRVENNTSAPRATQVSGAAAVYRPVAGVGGNQGRAQIRRDQVPDNGARSEEHTSELQSR